VSSKKYAIILLTMTGLLLCGPVFGSEIERWPMEKSLYGANEDHIKGDVFRVVVSYSNLAADSLRDALGIIYYPDGVHPYPDRLYQRQLTKAPWQGHFVDEKRHLIRFELGTGLKRDYNEFFSYFEADVYGNFDFDYSIEWTDAEGLRRRVTKDAQEIIIPDGVEVSEIPPAPPRTFRDKALPRLLYLALPLAGIVIGLLAGIFIARRKKTSQTQGSSEIDALIEHFENENNGLRQKISEVAQELDDVSKTS